MPTYQPQIKADQAPQERVVPPLLAELTPVQWAEWARHPVTALVLERYLEDLRHDAEAEVLVAWANMRMTPQYEQHMRGMLIGAQFLQTLTLDKVRAFYGVAAKPEPVAGMKFVY